MRDKKFYIDSIKMDLYRVVTAVGDIRKPAATESARCFLRHAEDDFKKMPLTERENRLFDKLSRLEGSINDKMKDPYNRLRWAEDVLTLRCML